MLLQEAYIQIARRTGLSSSSTTDKDKIVDALANSMKELSRRIKFLGERVEQSMTLTADTYAYYLDDRALYFQHFRDTTNGNKLNPVDSREFYRDTPDPDWTDTGVAEKVVFVKKVRCKNQPSSASVITAVSDSASDVTNYKVYVRGIVSGEEKMETLTLTGTTPVATTASFTTVISISKDVTVGNVTVTSNSGAVEIEYLQISQTERPRWYVFLYPCPDSADTVEYTFYRKPWAVSVDEDVIPIDEQFEDLLIDKTVMEILRQQGDKRAETLERSVERKINAVADEDFFSDDEDVRFGFDSVTYSEYT